MIYCLSIPIVLATNTNLTQYISQEAPGEWELASASFTPNSDGAVSLDGANYITASLKQGSTTVGTWNTNTGGTAHVAGTRIAPALSGGSALVFGQGDLLIFDVAKTGTGAVVKGELGLCFKKKQADAHYT